MLDSLVANKSVHYRFQFRLLVGWNDFGNRLTNHFFRIKSIEPFGSGVPAGNDSIEIFSNDRIVGVFHDCSQTLGVFLCASRLGGIAKDEDDTKNLAVVIFDWSGAVVDGSF